MLTINLQEKSLTLPGRVQSFWHQDEAAGSERTLFHRITIPLQDFTTGLADHPQAISPELIFDWYALGLDDIDELDGLNLTHSNYSEAEGDLLLAGKHNWCDVKELRFEKLESRTFKVTGNIVVEFEEQALAKNEGFSFETYVKIIED